MTLRDHPFNRILAPQQVCSVCIYDCDEDVSREIFRTRDILLEAPNWLLDETLILNGDGVLWTIDVDQGALKARNLTNLPFLNNDHVLSPDRKAIFASGFDWHVHRIDLATGETEQITRDEPARAMRYFLHGISPDGKELALIGVEPRGADPWGPANVFTLPASGGELRQITFGDGPADGSEYSPDGRWIYFNTEAFSKVDGHAQIARIAHAGGAAEQLTFDDRVNWFPHLSPNAELACYLSYPSGTIGHPADKQIELRLVTGDGWKSPKTIASFNGGQGTINVNSWSPDGRKFAYISYPTI